MNSLVRVGNRLINTDNINYVELQHDATKPSARVFLTGVPQGSQPYIEFTGNDALAWQNFADTICTTLHHDRVENSSNMTLRPARAHTGSAGA